MNHLCEQEKTNSLGFSTKRTSFILDEDYIFDILTSNRLGWNLIYWFTMKETDHGNNAYFCLSNVTDINLVEFWY